MPNGRTTDLEGAKVAVTGRFAAMSQREVAELVSELGGRFIHTPSRHATYLVVGQQGWPLEDDGRPTAHLQSARKLRAAGYPIEIITEEDFFAQLGLTDHETAVRRRYTIAQLSRILDIPADRIRAWIRAGLIEPVETTHRLALFDFQQVASAKKLLELVAAGLSPQSIRDGLEGLRRWLPKLEAPAGQLAALEHRGRLLIRLGDGRLAETSGQLQLEFDPAAPSADLSVMSPQSVEQWFEQAVACEDAGELGQAADAYREAVRLEPDDAVLHFNLGNVLYGERELEESETHFRAAVAHDASYVEAWNNLGSVLVELDRPEEAVHCFEHALAIMPSYADAHYNLGDTLAALGRGDDAQFHWRAYLGLDPTSPWAKELQGRLS